VPEKTDLDTELAEERHHLTESRTALRRMREHAEALYHTGDRVAGDAYTAEQLGRHMARRVAELADDPTTPLFFGRLELADDERHHIGRRHEGEIWLTGGRARCHRSWRAGSFGV